MNKSLIIVVHKVHTNPDDDLVLYVNQKKYSNVLHIRHSFSDAPDRTSYYTWYKNGEIFKEGRTRDYSFLPEPLLYLKEFFYTWYWVMRSKMRWDTYIGMDGLCTNFGLFLRRKFVQRVICWNLDFVPDNRFTSKLKNKIYRTLNTRAFLKSDEMWDHTQKMAVVKEEVLGIKPTDYKVHKVVPLGMWLDRVPTLSYKDCKKHTAVFMGHLLEKQGAQLVLQATKDILKNVPDFTFRIIGGGNYEPQLRKFSKDLKIEKHVEFLGKIESDVEMERCVSECAVGLAPYIKSLDTFTQFGADPGKLKTYLACGLPVLVTDVPWNAKDIETNGCGLIIDEDTKDIAEKISRYLLDGKANQKARDMARQYAKQFDYNDIFGKLDI